MLVALRDSLRARRKGSNTEHLSCSKAVVDVLHKEAHWIFMMMPEADF